MKKNLLIKLITATLAASTVLTPMSVLAAPKTMPDGGVFDPQYYASTYPDVVKALGADENVLYQHYL
ncbi:MAG: CAP domain-containing protein, partial [Firmicutes bacterium]|nr:CAP domain-containing protein [Bacillota bacterium]